MLERRALFAAAEAIGESLLRDQFGEDGFVRIAGAVGAAQDEAPEASGAEIHLGHGGGEVLGAPPLGDLPGVDPCGPDLWTRRSEHPGHEELAIGGVF